MSLAGTIIRNQYRIIEKIGEGGMSTVWIGTNLTDNSKVAVKVLKKEVTSNRIEDLIHYRNEAITVSKLNISGAVKIFEVGEINELQYMVMEYLEGTNMQELFMSGKKFTPNEALDIVKILCEVLKSIHNAGLVFRDLKPGNIMISSKDNLDMKLIDFGLSQIREYDYKDTKKIVGTLLYMSPEQSGVLKRVVDERADLYSLGVIFYQLLTSKLPFNGADINSIIHQHATKIPDRPRIYNPEIPKVVEDIVLRLLEKEPEKRYQSAELLLKDIEKVQNGDTDFKLSSNDELVRLSFRTTLVGRNNEYLSLVQMYENASLGNGSICLISGEAGRGKTRISEELKNYCHKCGGVFIDGKCFSGQNKMPYGVFIDVLNSYVKEYSRFDDDRRDKLALKAREYVGELGELILKLNPLANQILGECCDLVELEPESETKRFNMVVSQFIYALGEKERPLVVLLDDLQWVDEGSVGILDEISDRIKDYPVLVICTYRENEVTNEHVFQKFIKNGKDMSYPIKTINLEPFSIDNMFVFVSKLLSENDKDILKIARFIHKKSGGNPYFAIEILKQMITEKAIIRCENKWSLVSEILDSIQISSSIVDVLIKSISRLTQMEKIILSHAAVIGQRFDINLLLALIDLEHEQIIDVIDRMIKMQLLEKSNDKGKLNFAHDRLREAFYKNMTYEDRKKVHLKIACLIEFINRNDLEKVNFNLTHHFFEGDDMDKTLEYAFPSGVGAKERYAYESAYKYFLLSKNILDGFKDKEEFKIKCILNLAEVASYINKNDEAIALLVDLIPNAKENMDKVEAYRLICRAYYNIGDFDMSYKYGREGLVLLGEHLPESNLNLIFSIIKVLIIRQIYNFKNKPVYTRKIKHANSDTYMKIHSFYTILNNMTAYFSIKRFIYGIIRGFNLVEQKVGWSKDLAYGIGGYGGFMAATGNFEGAIKNFKIAVSIFNELKNPLGIAQEYQFMGITYEFCGDYDKSIELLVKSMHILKSLCEVKETNFSINALIRQYYYIGEYEKMNLYLEQYMELYKKTKDMYIKNSASVYKAQYLREKGELEKSLECGRYMLEPSFEIKDWYNYCSLFIAMGITYLELGESEKAMESLEKAKEINEKNSFFEHHVAFIYPALAEGYIMKYNDVKDMISPEEESEQIKRIRAACKLAAKKTSKFPTHQGTCARVTAQFNLLIGNNSMAETLFNKSIDLCTKYNRKYELGKSLYMYGMYLYSVLRHREAGTTIQNACNIFSQIDSKHYLKLCEKFLSCLNNKDAVCQDKVSNVIRNSQRIYSISSLAQKISSILNLELLLDTIMQTSLEVTGAQNGHLFLKDRKTGEMKQVVSKISDENALESGTVSESILNKVRESGEAVITTNAMEDEKYSGFDSVLVNGLKSVLCFPIKYNEEVKGICYLDNNITSSIFSEDDINILSIFMTQAAISIENAELYKMAITDGLTEMISHKHFKTLLEMEIQNSKRDNKVFSLIIFDIDYFKKVNDEYMHQAGDEVLVSISNVAKKIFRKSDILARYGGEEFAVILPETGSVQALLYAEKLRSAIENLVVVHNDIDIKVTISLGLAEYPEHAIDDTALINAADCALYISKQTGRNRTTVYNENVDTKQTFDNKQTIDSQL